MAKSDDVERELSDEQAIQALSHHMQMRQTPFALERCYPLCPACGRSLPAPPVSQTGVVKPGVAYAVACPGSNCDWQGKAVFVREQREERPRG